MVHEQLPVVGVEVRRNLKTFVEGLQARNVPAIRDAISVKFEVAMGSNNSNVTAFTRYLEVASGLEGFRGLIRLARKPSRSSYY